MSKIHLGDSQYAPEVRGFQKKVKPQSIGVVMFTTIQTIGIETQRRSPG